MVVACIARNGTCLNGLAKVVEGAVKLGLKRSNKSPINIYQLE